MAENQDNAALINGSVMKPDAFDGMKSKYIAWKTQMKLYVVTQRKRLPEQFDRVLMILPYMKGGHAGEYTTNELWTDLNKHFLIDEQAEAYDRLQAMQMGVLSMQEFFLKFELCAFQANIHDFEAHFQKLKSLLEKALRADIIRLLYNSSEELPATSTVGETHSPSGKDNFNLGSSRHKTRRDGTGVTFGGRGQPMELDQARRLGLCFRCREKGHLSRNCPNQQQAQQVQAAETPVVPTTNVFTPLASLQEAPAATAELFDWKTAIRKEIRTAMKGFASGQPGA
ncbi:uncharacterized protein PHACADRAFT_202086 [Phanerochaete carnosa HHB-10118-sp]|uniref:CCHC-type domain-containing protein n=1 Tax=Phanerochaete carnosa (strain HHB-10118-sp) TaxID=650164 RepID=K5VR42_PHACS|nr:uncharacterized protein PHACADRAFT_202086 [Phanerochaete carnosa HHB-10118-sp]EKM49044.1 hypothetical protein PHACADRAFT_202086 [Phanerochaete carnosa HHB-10118-sp]